MQIIEHKAEEKLIERLEDLQHSTNTTRLIYLNLAGSAVPPGAVVPSLIDVAELAVGNFEQMQLYLCEDGDIYLFCHHLPIKDIHLMVTYLQNEGFEEIGQLFHVYELPRQLYAVLTMVDKKWQHMEDRRHSVTQRHTTTQQELKRQSILEVVNEEHAKHYIARTRKARHELSILVIEDDSFTRQLVMNVLGKQAKMTGIGTTTQALSTYIKTAPNILFLDINLPDVSGHELLERVMELDPDAFVVMLSGNADRTNITTAMSKGAKGFVAKPFTRDKLQQYIQKYLSQPHSGE